VGANLVWSLEGLGEVHFITYFMLWIFVFWFLFLWIIVYVVEKYFYNFRDFHFVFIVTLLRFSSFWILTSIFFKLIWKRFLSSIWKPLFLLKLASCGWCYLWQWATLWFTNQGLRRYWILFKLWILMQLSMHMYF